WRAAGPQGRLRLGSMESTAASRLPLPLARLHARWPAVEIQLRTGTTRFLADAVASHALDCAIVAHPSAQPPGARLDEALGAALEGDYLFTEELLLITPPGNAAPRALATFARGCAYRDRAEQWLRDAGEDPARLQMLELGSYHAILACVMAGSAMAVLPRSVLDLQTLTPPSRVIGPAHCFLIRRKGQDSANYQALLSALRD
ncbi:LysR substrate-binding domain-containing protein, partial [Bordetella avium]|uniref:LysR substrate-binding domain-containing protein n=1 Tax=Bordetella avium TaxID=521 RepID=UPI00057AFD3F